MHWHTHFTFELALALGLLFPMTGMAACSRVINVPVAATGQSVIVEATASKAFTPTSCARSQRKTAAR
jgi:hypothetical protein